MVGEFCLKCGVFFGGGASEKTLVSVSRSVLLTARLRCRGRRSGRQHAERDAEAAAPGQRRLALDVAEGELARAPPEADCEDGDHGGDDEERRGGRDGRRSSSAGQL